jgi:hypothetical protein
MGVTKTDIESETMTNLNVFPNPTQNGIFNIISSTIINAQSIAVYDLSGRIVPFTLNGFANKYSINMSNSAKGIYQLKVGNTFTKISIQ